MKKKVTQVQATQNPNQDEPKRPTQRDIIIKPAKVRDQERTIRQHEKTVNYKGVPIRLSDDFSTETLQARRVWHEIYKGIKSKDLQPTLVSPARLSFKIEGKIGR